MKKRKWIKIYLKSGGVKEIDYGWQSTNYLGNLILTRIKDGKRVEIPLEDIEKCIYNSI